MRKPEKIKPENPEKSDRRRFNYTKEFKHEVVQFALQRRDDDRIKPTCRLYPGIQPVQLRRWIKQFIEEAVYRLLALKHVKQSQTNNLLVHRDDILSS